MKTQGDNKPDLYYYSQGGLIININEEQKTGSTISNEQRVYWEYDSIKVNEKPTKSEIVNSIIFCKYTPGAEISTINNYNTGEQKYIVEYQEYQNYRIFAKSTADFILNSL